MDTRIQFRVDEETKRLAQQMAEVNISRKVLKRPKLKQKTSFNGYEKNITNVNTNKEICI